jgi:hypothetical protein
VKDGGGMPLGFAISSLVAAKDMGSADVGVRLQDVTEEVYI